MSRHSGQRGNKLVFREDGTVRIWLRNSEGELIDFALIDQIDVDRVWNHTWSLNKNRRTKSKKNPQPSVFQHCVISQITIAGRG